MGSLPDPYRGCVYVYESEPERAVLTVLIADPDVLSIRVQRTVTYALAGVERSYTVDVVVERKGGMREAVAVKQTDEGLNRDETVGIMKAVCARHGSEFADDYRAVTYDTLDPVAVLNGRRIVRCGRDLDRAGMRAVREALPGLGPVTTLREIARATGLGRRGVRAATALLQSGVLTNPPGVGLGLDLPLGNRISDGGRDR